MSYGKSTWTYMSFNSLFEMHHFEVILLLGMPDDLSILYLRCRSRPAASAGQAPTQAFNSLFEMPRNFLIGRYWDTSSFNSLFEMLDRRGAYALQSVPGAVFQFSI